MTVEELITLVHKESLDYFKEIDSPFDITSKKAEKVEVRQVTYYVLCCLYQSLHFNGGISKPFEKYFNQDHSTLTHSKHKIQDYLSYDKNIIRKVKELKERCENNIEIFENKAKIKKNKFDNALDKIEFYNFQDDVIEFVELKIKEINDTQINTEEIK